MCGLWSERHSKFGLMQRTPRSCPLEWISAHCPLHLGIDALVYGLETRTLSWFGHGCTSNRMVSEHEGYSGLGMDVLVFCAWMHRLKNGVRGQRKGGKPCKKNKKQ